MTYVACAACGCRLVKADAIVSRFTGRVWCRDMRACDKRRQATFEHGENRWYGPGNPDWEHDREREDALL